MVTDYLGSLACYLSFFGITLLLITRTWFMLLEWPKDERNTPILNLASLLNLPATILISTRQHLIFDSLFLFTNFSKSNCQFMAWCVTCFNNCNTDVAPMHTSVCLTFCYHLVIVSDGWEVLTFEIFSLCFWLSIASSWSYHTEVRGRNHKWTFYRWEISKSYTDLSSWRFACLSQNMSKGVIE